MSDGNFAASIVLFGAAFALSLRVDAKRRRRGYDPQWR